ncbi:MAG: hypothetical protein RMJ84_02095 [Sandaracinaceae bacterium]|nr:hypothetical protein [Sandaracinaceae bacterium]
MPSLRGFRFLAGVPSDDIGLGRRQGFGYTEDGEGVLVGDGFLHTTKRL